MTDKLKLLHEYIDVQINDSKLWMPDGNNFYLRQELNRLSWLIQEATIEEIKSHIKKYKERLCQE